MLLTEKQKRRLQLKFKRVVRATVKGNLLVAITQGAFGAGYPQRAGLGAGGGVLPADRSNVAGDRVDRFRVLVIGLVDSLLRPILVGKDTRMPDYLVLVSTLGRLVVFGPLIAALFASSWAIFVSTKPQVQLPL